MFTVLFSSAPSALSVHTYCWSGNIWHITYFDQFSCLIFVFVTKLYVNLCVRETEQFFQHLGVCCVFTVRMKCICISFCGAVLLELSVYCTNKHIYVYKYYYLYCIVVYWVVHLIQHYVLQYEKPVLFWSWFFTSVCQIFTACSLL